MHPCRSARAHITNVVDGGSVPLAMKLWVACHRTFCPWCVRFEKSLRHTIELGHALRDLPLDDGTDEPPKAT